MPFSCNFFRCDFSSRAAVSARFHLSCFYYPLLYLTKAFRTPILQEIPIVSGGFFRTLHSKHRAKQKEARLHEACHRRKFLSTAAKQHASGARLSGFIIPAGRMRRLARPFFALIRFGYVSGRLRTAVRFFLCKHRPKTVRRDKNTVLFLPFCGILTCNVKTHTRKERFPYGREETRKFY